MKPEVIEYLKKEFVARWPDAARAINSSPSLPHEVHTKEKAACLWLGFRDGYALGSSQK